MAGPLQGLRVIEMAGIGPGPFCAMLFADMGAEVVRSSQRRCADRRFSSRRHGTARLGTDRMPARNPRLVYGRMTGWGQYGPLAQAAGHDINYIAISGALHAIGRAGEARCHRSTTWSRIANLSVELRLKTNQYLT